MLHRSSTRSQRRGVRRVEEQLWVQEDRSRYGAARRRGTGLLVLPVQQQRVAHDERFEEQRKQAG